jgi:hypothetical protein
MIFSNIILLVNLLLTSPMHVGGVAEYMYTLEGSTLKLKFEIEKHELMHFNINDGCDMKKMTAFCTSKYIKQNTTTQVNGDTVVFSLDNSRIEHGHFILNMHTDLDSSQIHDLRIQNSCFYEYDSTYNNRVILDVGKFQKSYILKKGKEVIDLR